MCSRGPQSTCAIIRVKFHADQLTKQEHHLTSPSRFAQNVTHDMARYRARSLTPGLLRWMDQAVGFLEGRHVMLNRVFRFLVSNFETLMLYGFLVLWHL